MRPGSCAPQVLSERANSEAAATGPGTLLGMRVTLPSFFSSASTFGETIPGGPINRISGLACRPIALRVGAGTALRLTNRTGSPERADHAAAGIAYAGWSAGATITRADGLPATAV